MSGLHDLPVHARKCAAARLLVREAVEQQPYGLGPAEQLALEQIVATVDATADGAFTRGLHASEPFPDFLRRMPQIALGSCSNEDRPLAEGLVAALRELIEEHLAGAPDAVQRVWPVAVDAALKLYAVGPRSTATPRLEMGFTIGVPHPFDIDGFALGGEVDETRAVRLDLQPPGLNCEGCLAILSVLLHELVCHALAMRHPRRPPSFEFGEGWMAAVAHDVLLAITEPGTPFSELARRVTDPVGARRAAQTLHYARLRPGNDGRGYASRRVGDDVATRIRDHIRAQRLDEGDGRTLFWRLSVALSRSAIEAPTLDRFCTRANHLLVQQSLSDGVALPLARCLDEFAAMPDAAGDVPVAQRLVEEVLQR